jgi:G3E family GTPase
VTKLVQIAGYLGSGKTTVIIAIGKGLSETGLKVAIIVNDAGAIPVDGRVMQQYGLTVKDIGGGCICCQVAGNLLKTLDVLAGGLKPDFIFVEPTGMAVPHSIRENVSYGAAKANITIGPTIVLFDATRREKLLTYDTLKRLIATQLSDADIIALSKVDLVSEGDIERSREAVRQINPKARVVQLSTRTGEGIADLLRAIEEMTIPA